MSTQMGRAAQPGRSARLMSSMSMATISIKSTYSLDVETVRALEGLARRWNVSKSEALRRIIRSAASRQSATGSEALNALDALQAAVRSGGIDLARWERDVKLEPAAVAAAGSSPNVMTAET